MKVANPEELGGPEVLQYRNVGDPVAGADDVVVDIHAASASAAPWEKPDK